MRNINIIYCASIINTITVDYEHPSRDGPSSWWQWSAELCMRWTLFTMQNVKIATERRKRINFTLSLSIDATTMYRLIGEIGIDQSMFIAFSYSRKAAFATSPQPTSLLVSITWKMRHFSALSLSDDNEYETEIENFSWHTNEVVWSVALARPKRIWLNVSARLKLMKIEHRAQTTVEHT